MPAQYDAITRPKAPRPLSPSLRGHYDTWQSQPGHTDDADLRRTLRPNSSPAGHLGDAPGEHSLRSAARPWTSASLASVKSFTTGYLASDSWNELFAPGSVQPEPQPEPNERTDLIAKGMVSKAAVSCSDYRLLKREDDIRALTGLWSTISFRRPRGMDIISEHARSTRKPPAIVADGFLSKGPNGQTPYQIALEVPLLQKLEHQNAGFIKLLVEADSLSYVSALAGQVLYREGDPACCSYVQLAGSVQMYSCDRDFLKQSGWHPMDTTDASPSSPTKLAKASTRPMLPTPRTEHDPSRYPTLKEYVHMARDEESTPRFRTLEGYSTFSKDSSFGELYDTSHALGTLIGESALVGKELWQHSARCIKDCDFLAINVSIFKKTLKTMRENQRFFDLYMPGLNKNRNIRPHPNDFFKREVIPEGECLLEEGMVSLEPAVFMVQRGHVELRRYRMSSANPAYVLSTRPLTGKPQKVTTQDVTCLLLPDFARTFTPKLDEEGLPRIGLPPALKGTMRQRLEDEYMADPSHFLPPREKKLSPEEAKVRHHKALLKDRMESTAFRKKERALKRDEELREARPLRQVAPEEQEIARNEVEIEQIRVLLEYVSTLSSARPGSPEHLGEDTWSERPGRKWLSPDLLCGPYSRPASAEMFTDPMLRTQPGNQDTFVVLKTGDMFCSLSFFPIWGAPEPFSAVAASPDCCVAYVRGVHEAKSIPKVLLKELRVELARALQARLNAVIDAADKPPSKASKDSGGEDHEQAARSQTLGQVQEKQQDGEEIQSETPAGVESVLAGASRQLESLTLPIPRRPSFHSSHSNRSLRSDARSNRSNRSPATDPSAMASGIQSFEEASDLPRRRRKRQKPVSFLRWLFFGKGGANKENRSWFRGRRSVRH